MLQPDKSYFILSMIKEVESHEVIIHWTLMKNSGVNNKHKNKDGKLKTILSIWYFKRKRFPDGILIKQRYRLCEGLRTQKWGVKYWETYAAVANWISVRSLFYIAISTV